MARKVNRKFGRLKPCRRVIGLTIGGMTEPEVYAISDDVYSIIHKLLSLNQFAGPYRGVDLIDFEEVRFLLQLLGVELYNQGSELDLWITDN